MVSCPLTEHFLPDLPGLFQPLRRAPLRHYSQRHRYPFHELLVLLICFLQLAVFVLQLLKLLFVDAVFAYLQFQLVQLLLDLSDMLDLQMRHWGCGSVYDGRFP